LGPVRSKVSYCLPFPAVVSGTARGRQLPISLRSSLFSWSFREPERSPHVSLEVWAFFLFATRKTPEEGRVVKRGYIPPITWPTFPYPPANFHRNQSLTLGEPFCVPWLDTPFRNHNAESGHACESSSLEVPFGGLDPPSTRRIIRKDSEDRGNLWTFRSLTSQRWIPLDVGPI